MADFPGAGVIRIAGTGAAGAQAKAPAAMQQVGGTSMWWGRTLADRCREDTVMHVFSVGQHSVSLSVSNSVSPEQAQ